MFCQHCGKEIGADSTYCPYCGGVNNNLAAGQVGAHTRNSSMYECPACHSTDITMTKGDRVRDFVFGFFALCIIGYVVESAGYTFIADFLYVLACGQFLYAIFLLLRKIFSSGESWECTCNRCHEKFKIKR